jgi:dTDP-4-amino-4,6-dideoxygalactose transaminase
VELKNYGSTIKYQHNRIGYNNRLDELQAAFLSLKLPLLDSYNYQRRAIASAYNSLLAGISGLVLPTEPAGIKHVYHIYSIRTNMRDALQQYLQNNGIQTLIHYPTPPYIQKAYLGMGIAAGAYPNADEVAKTCLSLPIYPGLSDEDVDYVASVIKTFFS